jgi:uncharacterized protein (TIGR02246 family)
MTVEEVVQQLDEAFNRGDVDAVLAFYGDDAAVVAEPGTVIRGRDALRTFFSAAMALRGVATQIRTNVIEAGELALLTSEWTFSATLPNGERLDRRSFASTVLRRSAQGEWRIVIDNAYGPGVLAAAGS